MAIGPTINDIREITSVLSDKLKIDFTNYAFSFLRRRFAYIFNTLKVRNANAFIELVKKGEILDDFSYWFPVQENEMFRDPSFWRNLRTKIIPNLDENNLTFWFPEMVATEELMSLLVILKEEGLENKAKVFCNVSSRRRIDEIKRGRVSSKFLDLNKSNFKRLELSSHFEDYFTQEEGFTKIDVSLIDRIEFLNGNYFTNLPNANIGVTIFRNKMLYYNSKLQSVAEKQLYANLQKGSYLALGINERILKENKTSFDLYDSGEQIYKVS